MKPLERVAWTLGLALPVCAAVTAATSTGFFESMELSGFDRLVLATPQPRSDRLAFVDISDATVASVGRWPIPRALVAEAIARVAQGGPELIGLDMALAEAREPAEDAAMAAALTSAGNVILVGYQTEDARIIEPLPAFRDAALDVGSANFAKDADGSIRTVPIQLSRPGYQRMGLAASLASNLLQVAWKGTPDTGFRLGERAFETEVGDGSVSIRLASWGAPQLRVDFSQVLKPAFDPKVFAGKVVVLGESSKAGKDTFETPLYNHHGEMGLTGLYAGPLIHLAAVDAILEGRVARDLPRVWLLNLVAALVALGLVMHGRPAWTVPFVLVLGLATSWGAVQLLRENVWLRFVSTEATLLLSLPVALGWRYLRESRQERRMRELFGRYVSHDVLAEIMRHPEQLAIEGQERVATVLFTDIRGFTATSAGAVPKDVIGWVNEYFAAMAEVIDANGGFLNKFIGDGLMIVYGAPVTHGEKDDACRAVRTALQMVKRLESLREENARKQAQGLWRPPVFIGLGIHTGPLAAGNVGSPQRMEYSVIGETVNLAARLESATRKFDVDLIVSGSTAALVEDRFVVEKLGQADAKGFSQAVEVYTVRSEKITSGGSAS